MNELRGSLVVVASAFVGAGVACGLMLWGAGFVLPFTDSDTYACNVLKVPVYGSIVSIRPETFAAEASIEDDSTQTYPTYDSNYAVSTEIEETIRLAAQDPSIKGFLIDVDSYGGTSVASGEIAMAIRKSGKPSVAVVHEYATSGGYQAAAGTDMIFASKDSTVGSIAVTYSFTEQSKKDAKEGITFNVLSSGPYKDTFSPSKSLTAAERALIMRDVELSHKNFVEDIAYLRQLPVEQVAALADGSAMLGGAALQAGLIDAIGGTDEALAYLEQAIGEPVSVCW